MHSTWKRVCLDNAADSEPSVFEREMDRVMRDLPTPIRAARSMRRTSNGNLVQAR